MYHLFCTCMYMYVHVYEAAHLFAWKKELSSGVVALLCLVSMADYIS